MLLTHGAVEPIGQGRIEEDLDEDGQCKQQDDQRLLQDGLLRLSVS